MMVRCLRIMRPQLSWRGTACSQKQYQKSKANRKTGFAWMGQSASPLKEDIPRNFELTGYPNSTESQTTPRGTKVKGKLITMDRQKQFCDNLFCYTHADPYTGTDQT